MRNQSIYMNIPVSQDMRLNREARVVDVIVHHLKERKTVYERLTTEEDRRLDIEAQTVDILMELAYSAAQRREKEVKWTT